MQCLDMYHYFLTSIPQVPEAVVKSLFELEKFTKICLEKVERGTVDFF
jgi:hypothetical protein